MERIKINTGLKQYGIENENGEIVAVLTLDTMNNNIVNQFADLVEKANVIHCKFRQEYDLADNDNSVDTVRKLTEIYRKSVNQLIEETEKVFGDGLIHDIFSKNYELDENFIPDVTALSDFYEQIIPILQSVYGNKINERKYSPTKKGKKTREDKIAEYKELMSNE